MTGKVCTKCKVHKPFDGFPKDRGMSDGHNSWCRACHVLKTRRYRERIGYFDKQQAKALALRTRIELGEKTCTRCKIKKPFTDFAKHAGGDGYNAWCRSCYVAKSTEWAKNNPERAKERSAKWKENNLDRKNEIDRQWRVKNIDRYRETHRKIEANRRATLKGNLDCRMVTAIGQALNGNKRGRRWEDLVGYTVDELKQHIEKYFYDGMSWDNRSLWHIDHVIPKSVFNYEKPEDLDFEKCWELKNLRPMWAIDNMKKQDKLEKPFQPSLAMGG
jgi:hypothetical protein